MKWAVCVWFRKAASYVVTQDEMKKKLLEIIREVQFQHNDGELRLVFGLFSREPALELSLEFIPWMIMSVLFTTASEGNSC